MPIDREVLAAASAREVIDAVVEAVVPVDGTQDTEASRNAMGEALSEVLEQHPDADLLNLDLGQRLLAVQEYVAADVFRRFCLDVGKAIQTRAPTAAVGQDRLRQAKDYIRETILASFRTAAGSRQSLSQSQIRQLVQRSLSSAIEVFQGYAE